MIYKNEDKEDYKADFSVEKPIFIVGAPRSGNTWLGQVLENHRDVACWDETNNIWIWGNLNKPDDVLTEKDCSTKIARYIRYRYDLYLREKEAQRVCDKTPRNCLRMPMILKVFPDAQFIMLLRDGRSVINSTQKELHREGEEPLPVFLKNQTRQVSKKLRQITIWEIPGLIPSAIFRLKRMMGVQLNYWGAKPPGWKEWVNRYPEHILLAKQWAATIEKVMELRQQLPSESYLEIKYEDLMLSTETEIKKVTRFLELEDTDNLIEYAIQTADPSRMHKWKEEIDEAKLQEVKDIMEPVMNKIGYQW